MEIIVENDEKVWRTKEYVSSNVEKHTFLKVRFTTNLLPRSMQGNRL